jgi:hypothetical protein
MNATGIRLSTRDRILAVLDGRAPDRVPFCDRLELWHTALLRQGRLPAEFEGLTLDEVHAAVGIGRQAYLLPFALRLRGVELTITREDERGTRVERERDPVLERFPLMYEQVEFDRVGTTTFEFRTAVGAVRLQQKLIEEAVLWAENPYLVEHPIKGRDDYRVVEHILDHVELVPLFDRFRAADEALGANGFGVPMLRRIPFQEVLIDWVGEMETFFALHDDPAPVRRLLAQLHELDLHVIAELAALDVPYVEFPDNLTGHMTNPRLFAEHSLPAYQEFTELLHAQGKKVGSHTDGNLRPLLALLRESGLDVCESFSPAPLTETTFDEAWEAWRGRPLMWGAIPTPLLEERTPEAELHGLVDHILDTVERGAIVLGPSDMVLGHNLIERVRWVARRLEERPVA